MKMNLSVDTLRKWDLHRIVVGHGESVESDGKHQLAATLTKAGF